LQSSSEDLTAPLRILKTCALLAISCVAFPSAGYTVARAGDRFQSDTAGPAPVCEAMFQVGEELEYSVHYSFFHIGTIRFKVTDKEEQNGRTIYHAYAFMDSNPSLSWLVDLHIRFYSAIDQNAFTYGWISDDSSSDGVKYRRMRFDYPKHKMYFEWGKKLGSDVRQAAGEDTIAIDTECQDGLSLFYYARAHLHQKKNDSIPTFIDTTRAITNVNFLDKASEIEIDAVDYPIDVVRVDGRADFVGVFGLTGGFEGWFSNDSASVPIVARLRVILGSIRVELTKWKREGWAPLKAMVKK
jgi:hypothetical protein